MEALDIKLMYPLNVRNFTEIRLITKSTLKLELHE